MQTSSGQTHIRYCMIGFFRYAGDARVKNYAELLQKAGNSVDVLCLQASRPQKRSDDDSIRLFSIPVAAARKSRLGYMLEYCGSFLLLGFLLTRMYFQNRYDVIHVHNMPDFLVFCAFIPKLFGAKVILDVHDPMPEVYQSKYPARKDSFALRLLRFEERVSAAFADAVIAANPHFRDALISRGVPASKVTTINNYPDPSVFHRSKRPASVPATHERFTLIFPGTIAPRYGLEVAVRALPLLKERISNIRLLIIGRLGEHSQSLQALAARLQVSDLVQIKPGIPNTEVPEQLLQADVGIYPALPDCHMSIAAPGKLLEFAIMGLPIISSRLQIVEEMFDDSAILFFEPGDPAQFAQRVLKLHDDPQLRDCLVSNADQILAQRHSREREVGVFSELLARLVPRQSVGGWLDAAL